VNGRDMHNFWVVPLKQGCGLLSSGPLLAAEV